MTTNLQFAIVGVLVAAAMVYVARAVWKTWFGKSAKGCGSGCGKCSTTVEEPKQEGRYSLPQV